MLYAHKPETLDSRRFTIPSVLQYLEGKDDYIFRSNTNTNLTKAGKPRGRTPPEPVFFCRMGAGKASGGMQRGMKKYGWLAAATAVAITGVLTAGSLMKPETVEVKTYTL